MRVALLSCTGIVAGLSAGLLTTPSLAEVFSVAPDGSGYYPTIAAALAAAEDGDEILLLPGVFSGEGNVNLSFQGKAIHVRSSSNDPAACTIDCSGPGDARAFEFYSGESAGSRLTGVTIAGGSRTDGGALVVSLGAGPTISGCVFRDCTADRFGGAVYCQGACAPVFEECLFLENTAVLFGGACYADVGAEPSFAACTFAGNAAGNGGAVFVRDGMLVITGSTLGGNIATVAGSGLSCDGTGSVALDRTLITGGVGGEAIFCDDTFTAILTACDLFGNEGGDWTAPFSGQLGMDGNISASPQFCEVDPLGHGSWVLQSDSPCAPAQAGELIGAWPVGCEDTPGRRTSWGRIKALFGAAAREERR